MSLWYITNVLVVLLVSEAKLVFMPAGGFVQTHVK